MAKYDGFKDILVRLDGGVLTCTLNRPHALNAYTPDTLEEIYALCRDVAQDDAVRVVVLTGAGRAFCAGGDVKRFDSGETDVNAILQSTVTDEAPRGFAALPQPCIAAVNGDAVGGGIGFALQCDVILASDNARFAFTYSRLGMPPSAVLLAVLPLLVNINRAKEYIFSGELFSAAEAERIGLVNHVHPNEQLMAAAERLAARIAESAPTANRWAKLLINKELVARNNLMRTASSGLMALSTFSEDYREGARSFVEKRKPRFTGK